MKITKRLTALLLTLTIALTLTACATGGGTPSGEVLADADKALADNSYTARVSIIYASENEEMAAAIEALNTSSITIKKNKDAKELTLTTEVGGFTMTKSYVTSGTVLYHTSIATLGEATVTVKEKATVTAVEALFLRMKLGSAAILNTSDFSVINITKGTAATTVSCSSINADSLEALEGSLTKSLNAIGAESEVTAVNLSATVKDGRYVQSTLTATLEITLGEASYTITLTEITDYTYSDNVVITLPENPDEYTTVSYDEIVK